MNVTELRRGIGYVIQQVGLFPHMTVADNVATVPRLLGRGKSEIERRVDELLDLVDLPAADYRARVPSPAGGERQRVGRTCARREPAGHAHGRAVRRGRPDHACPAPARAAPDPERAAQDDHLRHARHRRGDHARRPHRDPARGRRARPVRHAGGILTHPADSFVERFIGSDRGIKLLALRNSTSSSWHRSTAPRPTASRRHRARRRFATQSR